MVAGEMLRQDIQFPAQTREHECAIWGVGANTPVIISFFWQMAIANKNSTYAPVLAYGSILSAN